MALDCVSVAPLPLSLSLSLELSLSSELEEALGVPATPFDLKFLLVTLLVKCGLAFACSSPELELDDSSSLSSEEDDSGIAVPFGAGAFVEPFVLGLLEFLAADLSSFDRSWAFKVFIGPDAGSDSDAEPELEDDDSEGGARCDFRPLTLTFDVELDLEAFLESRLAEAASEAVWKSSEFSESVLRGSASAAESEVDA